MIREPESDSMDFQLLVLYIYGRQMMIDVEEGKQPPPEHLMEKALTKAREKFLEAESAEYFEDIVQSFADCRELLSTLKATYLDIGVDKKRLRAVEGHLRTAKTKDPAHPVLSGRSAEDHIAIICNGNQRLLD